MPSRCVAAGCSNTTREGVSLHGFPSDAYYRRIWMANVKLTRAIWPGPSEVLDHISKRQVLFYVS